MKCQQCKVTRHNKFLPNHFITPNARFDHIHLDLVGQFPYSSGYTHVFTMIDRFSRWPEAVPIEDTSAATVARAFYDNWIDRYGTLLVITTDQGVQFESRLFTVLLTVLGIGRNRTTAYRPASNGMVERLHREIKTALMCHSATENWVRLLPTIMLGLRTRLRRDAKASPSDLVFGKSLRIPEDFSPLTGEEPDVRNFYNEFREYMRQLRPVPVEHRGAAKPFIHHGLDSCTHVWMKAKPVKPALSPPFVGPFKVISRNMANDAATDEQMRLTWQGTIITRDLPATVNNPIPIIPNSTQTEASQEERTNCQIPSQSNVITGNIPSIPRSILNDAKKQKFVPNILKRNRLSGGNPKTSKRVSFADQS